MLNAKLPPQALNHMMFGLLAVAILANGLYFWLQKSQILPSNTYLEYRQEVVNAHEKEAQGIYVPVPHLKLGGFYSVPGYWILTKTLKDLFCITFVLVSLLLWRHSMPAISPPMVLVLLLGLVVTWAFFNSVHFYGAWVAVLGLRPFAFLFAGLLGAWFIGQRSLDYLCRYLLAVLVLELALALYEYNYGLPLFSTTRLRSRVNGTFSFPASLGIFAVSALSFAFTFSTINKLILLIPVALLVYLTGSGTALVLLTAWLGMWALAWVPGTWKSSIRVASLAVVVTMLLLLPKVMDRHDVLDSLWGRVEVAADYVNHLPNTLTVLFGKGLGIGSNVLNSAITQLDAINGPKGVDMSHVRADSTPMALMNQIGAVGTLLFYLLLATGAFRDRPAVPIYLIMFLASLTVNLLELFPVNFLLGLLLCRSLTTPLCYSTKSARIERQINRGNWLFHDYREIAKS